MPQQFSQRDVDQFRIVLYLLANSHPVPQLLLARFLALGWLRSAPTRPGGYEPTEEGLRREGAE